ncbi:AraC family transcriptional regulator N-terminal domain-containing protein [Uliginosibacterium sp. sgz301328]|uniref:AraC family transcriptional regulator n=1 Tax=Uliginosibacterium sp. sgz301328 TaxID=3243764 RepID=UPI00359CF91A
MPKPSCLLPDPAFVANFHPMNSDATQMTALVDAINRYTARQQGESPFYTEAEGLIVLRALPDRHPTHLVHKPALCIVVQGAKWTTFGSRRLEYRAGQAMVVSLEMPGSSQVMEGSKALPYLSVVIELDQAAMREVLAGLPSPPVADVAARDSAFVMPLGDALIDCALRAIRLLDTPEAIPVLYPLLMREICFWLLSGPHGGRIAQIIVGGPRHQGVVEAMHVLRERFAQSISIEELAALAKLSPSAFHHKFKALTSVTPLQYQKQIRLLEARRLMAAGEANVQSAAVRVGYESASQFNREYVRMFGAPPKRDILEFGQVRDA